MLNRASIIHDNFIRLVKSAELPQLRTAITPQQAGMSEAEVRSVFHSQVLSRQLDLMSRTLKDQNKGFYTISSSGHEGNAAIGAVLRLTDPAFCHYRDGAFFIERLKKIAGIDIPYEMMLSFVASREDAISGGRHKVLGSFPGFVPPQTSTIASHLPKAVGAAFSVTLARELAIPSTWPQDSVVMCSFGDASLNHSVAQGAMNAASWMQHSSVPLPLLFVCEDNGIGISVPTPKTWIETSVKMRPHWHYIAADGLNFADVFRATRDAMTITRQQRKPVFLHMRCVRLMGHAGSDIEQQYKTEHEICANESQDPLLHSARLLIEQGYETSQSILTLYTDIAAEVEAATERALKQARLTSAKDVMASLIPPIKNISLPKVLSESARRDLFAEDFERLSDKRNLCQNINAALTDVLAQYPTTVLFGEDVAKKGGVYRVTAGLVNKFGKRRVFDSLLDETTILGNAIGLAHNGFLPIPEIQFLAYYHNAEDQIRGEAATLSFFSQGQFTNPMVIRIAGLAYQKGFGGHFHNDNSLAVLRDVPGVIVACPARGRDAAMMLRECVRLAYQEQRVVVFLEPIALYMTRDLHDTGDQGWLDTYPQPHETIRFGELGITGSNESIAIISYANGYYHACQAAKILAEKHKIIVKLIDLRWLAPLNTSELVAEIKHCCHVLIVDECRRTGSISEELMALFIEKLNPLPHIKRLTAEDCFIPLGTAWQYLLPDQHAIVKAVLEFNSKQ